MTTSSGKGEAKDAAVVVDVPIVVDEELRLAEGAVEGFQTQLAEEKAREDGHTDHIDAIEKGLAEAQAKLDQVRGQR